MLLTGCERFDTGPLVDDRGGEILRAAPCEPTGTVPKPSSIAYDAGGPYLAESVVEGHDPDQLQWRVHPCRIVAVDAPETVKEASPVECGGPGASAYVRSQLDGGQVFLSMDPAQGEQDKYDRLLAYVWTADGALINQSTVGHGQGQGTGYGKDYAMSSTFEAASEQVAKARALGFVGRPTMPATKPKCSATIIFFLLVAGNESASVGYGVAGL